MARFDPSGGLLAIRLTTSRQSLPADGGLIATDPFGGSAVTMDANLNITGAMGNLPTQSWTGTQYQMGSVESVAIPPTQYATSYAAVAGGNPSARASAPSEGTYVPSLGAIFRAQIAELAKGYIGNSSRWEETNGTTCNLFVRDVLNDASSATQLNIPAPVRPNLAWYQLNSRHPFLAADWANPNVNGQCWKTLPGGPDASLPGDVIATGYPANTPDTTGHVGIIVEPDSGSPNYKDASAADIPPYWWTTTQKQSFIPGTITLTDYGFRLVGFDTSDPTDNQGLKQDTHVRRFSCY